MTPDDAVAVTAQLGRPPRGQWTVVRRCACGLPMVIETAPALADGTPFPTLWWLTCRSLGKSIGRLEAGGWMAACNRRLAAEPDLAAALASATQAYAARRGQLPLPTNPRRGHPGGGGTPGGRVKCLHAHTAHQLVAGDNPVGAAVLAELGWVEPAVPCV
ncbi:MAG TPA: DUF501 domain-containing protein [Actinomycetota bacterium]|nr:DUF501 domain-containing protein [Actinomycetota bacterium]